MAGSEVTIWEADGAPWPGAGYGSDIARRLRSLGYSPTTVPLQERLPDERELAAPAHVLSGGSTPATTATGWVAAARGSLVEVLERATTGAAAVVGICFGAQLMAVALAGPRAVRPARRGMEAGLHRVRCARTGRSSTVAQFHHHEIRPEVVESAGARITHSNDHTRVQGFEFGSGIAGYQFHPEMDPQAAAATYFSNGDVLRATGACAQSALDSVRRREHKWEASTFRELVGDRLATAVHTRSASGAAIG